jgi:glucose/arabinose dehydrogenase
MARSPVGAGAVVAAIVLLAAACSGGDSPESESSGGAPTTSSTTTAPSTTTTTTRPADLAAVNVVLTPVAPATAPTALAARAGDPALYVAEQAGRVLAIRDGAVDPVPVLDLSGEIASDGEQGLLGLEFSPAGDRLYVHFSARNGDTTVDEYAFTGSPGGGGAIDPATRRTLLTVDQPQANHNGGQLAFGPDGALYLGLGDGGGAGDEGSGHAPEGNGQSPDTLLGKIVRIDPVTGAAEVFSSGLRNPWRFSFDRENGELWIGDVGQNAFEEIDHLPFAQARGANFGWPLLEGSHPYRADSAPGTVLPVFEVDQSTGACAIIGGYAYRGSRIPDLRGSYLFSDNCDGRVRALRIDDAGAVALERELGVETSGPTSFGEGPDGALYVLSGSDGVFRIDPA